MSNPQVIEHRGSGGSLRVFVTAPGQQRKDVTMFRGVPTKVDNMSSTDPFGDAAAQITFPKISSLDRPGSGDLSWLVPMANVDIVFYYEDGTYSGWAWEGMIFSENPSLTSLSVTCKGALYQADNFLAAPWYPQYPVPYELLIKNALDPAKNPTLRTAACRVQFPDDWNLLVPKFDSPDYLWFLRPWGVSPGQKWTGMTTRNTGGWEPKLTGFVQGLLSVMYTPEGGQWTVFKSTGRVPVMKIRPVLLSPAEDSLTLYNGAPGVDANLSRDFSQSTNVVYGVGTDLSGSSFSGQQVSADGITTFYDPFAALPSVHPVIGSNPRLNRNIPRKESKLTFPNGMDELAARDTSASHLQRFADPGYTGEISLTSDPMVGSTPYNRMLIKAGQDIVLKNWRGADLILHVTTASASPSEGTVSLTVDSKFRDALTVDEVMARTRDALDPIHALKVGTFAVTTQDMVKPWSYTEGSGIIPTTAKDGVNKKQSPSSRFPWTDFTKAYPPKKYPGYYVKLNPASKKADDNWSGYTRSNIAKAAVPVLVSQQGAIRLTQIAAYDENGDVMKVRFHVSFYGNSGTSVRDMPMVPKAAVGSPYPESQRYPFFKGAFEQVRDDGTEQDNPGVLLPSGADLIVGWGNYYEGAGYWPGTNSGGGSPTGMLADESTWNYNTTQDPSFDKFSTKNTAANPSAGLIYIMIYCDAQGNKPVYFHGRLFVTNAGT